MRGDELQMKVSQFNIQLAHPKNIDVIDLVNVSLQPYSPLKLNKPVLKDGGLKKTPRLGQSWVEFAGLNGEILAHIEEKTNDRRKQRLEIQEYPADEVFNDKNRAKYIRKLKKETHKS